MRKLKINLILISKFVKVMNTRILKKSVLIIPSVLLLVYFCAGILYDPSYVVYIKPLIIPTFMLYAILNNSSYLTLKFYYFVFFFYTYHCLFLIYHTAHLLYGFALAASFFCYLALINLVYQKLKSKKMVVLPTGYSFFVLVLNFILLSSIVYILTPAINQNFINIMIIFNALVAVALGTTAVLYLGRFSHKKSFYYFFGAFALIFNDIFAALSTYILEDVVLNTIDRILQFLAFILIYFFIISDKKKVENDTNTFQPL